MTCQEIIKQLKKKKNPKNIAGMARFGINSKNALGISIPTLRAMAKEIGINHKLACQLWETDIHEARHLAGMIDDYKLLTSKQMDHWVSGFDSWDICDGVCMNLFDKSPYAFKKIKQWAKSNIEFTRRAGFSLLACMAFRAQKTSDKELLQFFPLIKKYSTDERNFVRKAVNWALRQIGKRNKNLCKKALILAEEIKKLDTKSSRWIASNAISELKQKLPNLK